MRIQSGQCLARLRINKLSIDEQLVAYRRAKPCRLRDISKIHVNP